MSRAEEFIKKQSHIIENPTSVWISSYNARKAVEIAREEMLEWLSYHLDTSKIDVYYKFDVIEELRKAMKDE